MDALEKDYDEAMNRDFLDYLYNDRQHKFQLVIAANDNDRDIHMDNYLNAVKEYARYTIEHPDYTPPEDQPSQNILRHEAWMKQQAMQQSDTVDMVNSPPHYTHGDIECIDAIRAALGPEGFAAFCRGNVIKYNFRCDHKGGVQDVEKAKWYLDKLIDTMRTKAEHTNPFEKEHKHR